MTRFAFLPTLAEQHSARSAVQKSAMTSQLQDDKAAARQAKKDEAIFRAAVWQRDAGLCRCCGRKVRKTIARVPERGEVHHVHGRIGALRYLVQAAVLLCAEDHEKVTGTVGMSKLRIVGSTTFKVDGVPCIDCSAPVRFVKVS